MILGVETSCDETAAALVTGDGEVRSNVVASQAELHARYGGVVPEVASRRHLELVGARAHRGARAGPAPRSTTSSRVAVTHGPGLIGALLVGLSAAKALAWSRRLPLVPVDHLHGHVASLYLEPGAARAALPLPARERRATRCSSTCARMRATRSSARPSTTPRARPSTRAPACSGSATRAAPRSTGRRARAIPRPTRFPVARVPGFDFSFSGLKTALLYAVRDLPPDELERRRADLAASYQRAIVRALVERTRAAAAELGAERIAVVGGVAANSELRSALADAALAPLALCTDNAAMIASAARFARPIPFPQYLALDAYATAA